MSIFPLTLTRRNLRGGLLLSVLLGWGGAALAGPIPFDDYLQFSFTEAGSAGCYPTDPNGDFCIPSSGTPTSFLDAPPWTFTAASAATLTVLDAFLSGDQFEVFDFGTSLGLSSAPVLGADCGDDPVTCLANNSMSKLVAALTAGAHSITIVPVLVPEFGGTGYLQVTGTPGTTPVPEPAPFTLWVLGGLVLALGWVVRSQRSAL